jgi:catabolic acetolactate synthase
MAAAIGRLTGRPGICIATSGPGGLNLTTALSTANSEGDPVVALVGSVPRAQSLISTHQSTNVMNVLAPIAKKTFSLEHEDQVAPAFCNAIRLASIHPQGVTAIDLPLDIMSSGKSTVTGFAPASFQPPSYGPPPREQILDLCERLSKAKLPVLLLGMRASSPRVTTALQRLLRKHEIPVLETFQGAGAVSRELLHLFYGRVGLFRNQPGDKLLAASDLVITLGYEPAEYDPFLFNPDGKCNIIHIDNKPCDRVELYQPQLELLGSLVESLDQMSEHMGSMEAELNTDFCKDIQRQHSQWRNEKNAKPKDESSPLVHPLHFISTLQDQVKDETVICCDVGSVYIWTARFLRSFQPRKLLFSNVSQTLGVALPWAIAASLVQNPNDASQRKKVISISGDGGFMFTSMELSTAVQEGCDITHFIWNDEQYNMVAFQEEAKYGRASGVTLGGVDFVKFAEAFGAKGFKVQKAGDLERVMREALAYKGVSIVEVMIDYSSNSELMANVLKSGVN